MFEIHFFVDARVTKNPCKTPEIPVRFHLTALMPVVFRASLSSPHPDTGFQ